MLIYSNCPKISLHNLHFVAGGKPILHGEDVHPIRAGVQAPLELRARAEQDAAGPRQGAHLHLHQGGLSSSLPQRGMDSGRHTLQMKGW